MRMSSMFAGLTLGAAAGFIMAYQNSAGESGSLRTAPQESACERCSEVYVFSRRGLQLCLQAYQEVHSQGVHP